MFNFELKAAMHQPGCALCRLQRESEERYLWGLLYEGIGDGGVHQRLGNSLGLCPFHSHLIAPVVAARQGLNGVGVGWLYQTIVSRYLERLAALSPPRGQARRLTPRGCSLCGFERGGEGQTLLLALALERQELSLDAVARSPGLCNPHLVRVLAHLRDPRLVTGLLTDQRRRFAALRARGRRDPDGWREALWRVAGVHFQRVLLRDVPARGGQEKR